MRHNQQKPKFEPLPHEIKLLVELRRLEQRTDGRPFDAVIHGKRDKWFIYFVTRPPVILDR